MALNSDPWAVRPTAIRSTFPRQNWDRLLFSEDRDNDEAACRKKEEE
jgi:hypothetical protein